jgi:hypothetical protein
MALRCRHIVSVCLIRSEKKNVTLACYLVCCFRFIILQYVSVSGSGESCRMGSYKKWLQNEMEFPWVPWCHRWQTCIDSSPYKGANSIVLMAIVDHDLFSIHKCRSKREELGWRSFQTVSNIPRTRKQYCHALSD